MRPPTLADVLDEESLPGRWSAIFNAQLHGAKIDGKRNRLRDGIETEVSSPPT